MSSTQYTVTNAAYKLFLTMLKTDSTCVNTVINHHNFPTTSFHQLVTEAKQQELFLLVQIHIAACGFSSHSIADDQQNCYLGL